MKGARMPHVVRSIFVVLVFLGMVAVNGLANSLPLNGVTTGEVSDSFDVRFVPAGYVFSIWGVIYLGLMAFTANLLRPSVGSRPRVPAVTYLFMLNGGFNAAWLVAWHYQRFVLSLVLMVGLLATLIAMYLMLEIGRSDERGLTRWLLVAPVQLYLAWISVATVANVTTTLDHLGWGGLGVPDEAWAAAMLVVCAGLAAAMCVTRRDAIFAGVVAWASAGIAVAQADAQLVRVTAWVVCGVAVVLLVVSLVWRRGAAPAPIIRSAAGSDPRR